MWIVKRGTELLRQEANLLELEGPITSALLRSAF